MTYFATLPQKEKVLLLSGSATEVQEQLDALLNNSDAIVRTLQYTPTALDGTTIVHNVLVSYIQNS